MKNITNLEAARCDLNRILAKNVAVNEFTEALENRMIDNLDSILDKPLPDFAAGESPMLAQGLNAREWMIDNYSLLQASMRIINLQLDEICTALEQLMDKAE